MKHWLTSSRRLPQRLTAKILLRLETLEERTLLDGTGQVLYHPEAILAPGYGKRGVPVGPPSSSRYSPPPPGGFANVLVNDPGEDGTSADDTQSETALTLDGSTVIAAYNDSFKAAQSPPHYTGFSRSDDGGQTFVDGGGLPNVNSTTGDVGDPVLAHDNQTGRTYLVTLGFTTGFAIPAVYVWRSDDDLQTFLAPVGVTRSGASLDKEWLAVDNFKGPGQGNVYLILRDFGSGNGIFLFHSTDQGATFGPSGGVQIASGANGNVQGAWVTVGPDHAVYAFWFDNTTSTESIKMRKSTDGGQTFGNPVTVTTLRTTGVNGDLGLGGGFRSNAFPQAVVNPVTGQIYVAYDDKGAGNDKADVYFRYSSDGGTTWSAATDVIDDTTGHDQWQPALAVTPNGNDVGVFWYDRRVDPGNSLIDRFGAIGVVAGDKVTFGPNFRITDTSFPVEIGHDPQINGIYMGDYDTAVADNSGFYLTWGDNRLPSQGHVGHNADVRFAHITVSTAGPAVIGVTPRGAVFPPVSTLRVTFDEPIDPTTFTPDQFQLTDSSGNPINIDKITPVDDSDLRFDVTFDSLSTTDVYSYKIGPYIADQDGNYMDQNGDGIPGEDPDDAFFGTIAVAGPKVTASTPAGNANLPGTVDHVRLTFNEPIDPTTFTPDQVVSFTGPDGSQIPINDIEPVANSNNTQFDVSFDTLTVSGTYQMVIGPYILDVYGNAMDQNGNFIPGEVPDDQYTATFSLAPPQVSRFARNGQQNQPATSVRVTFNEPIDPSTFTPDQIVNFVDPQGNPITVTDVEPVAGTNNTQFDITFDQQTLAGTYTLQIAAGILDFYGNALPTAYTGMFIITPVYTASAYDFEPLDIHGLPGTFRVIQYADDTAVAVNLGSHTFNFYGVIYTGNNQLFVSSNGLITFGSGYSSPGNTDLTTAPSQPAIAVLWSDWIKTSGTDMVEAYFDDANDRLILQWNAVQHYPSSPRGITFQLILYLDTGGNAGDIVFNYVDLDTGDGNRNGLTATVGIKSAGNQGVDRVLVSYDHSNPLVGSNLAILLSADAGGGPGIRGGRLTGDAVASSAALAPLADVLPVTTTPQPLTVTRSPGLAHPEEEGTPLALLETASARSVDQVFARFTAEDLLAGARHHSAAALDDMTDPLTLDLVGEPL